MILATAKHGPRSPESRGRVADRVAPDRLTSPAMSRGADMSDFGEVIAEHGDRLRAVQMPDMLAGAPYDDGAGPILRFDYGHHEGWSMVDGIAEYGGEFIAPADYLEARARAASAHLRAAREALAKAQHEAAALQAMVDGYEATISMYRAAADTLRGGA